MTTIIAFWSARSSNSLWLSVPATAASSLTTREIAAVYGRACVSASCARRNFAVETSFIARVILRVFLTDVMRVRIALRLGIALLLCCLVLDRELLRELGECVAQPLLDVALELSVRLELGDDVRLARLHEGQQLLLVATEDGDRVVIDEAVGAGIDHDDLLLH